MEYTVELIEGELQPSPVQPKEPVEILEEELGLSKQERLRKKKAQLADGGGVRLVEKQHAAGKLTARERLELLFDAGSFQELGMFVTHRCTDFGMADRATPCEGVVTGFGTVNGRLTYAAAQDFTVMGGSLGEMHASKIAAVQKAALKAGAPMICINDSGGARIQEGVDALAGYGSIFYNSTISSGVIPQISVIMGPSAGGAVYCPALTDFIFMVEKTSKMFITGPQVIKTVIGETVTGEALGGAAVHNSVSGCAHFQAADERECIAQVKRLLSFLPQNCRELPPCAEKTAEIQYEDPKLDSIVPDSPNRAYDMLEVIRSLADNGEVFQYQEAYAKNMITAFIRMGGRSVGVIANQPRLMAGCLDINASDKASRFIRTCDCFNVPLLTLEDVPGFLPGTQQEHGGIIRHGAKVLYAYSEATVPKVTVITRKAYGGAYIGMCSKHLGADMVFAWPSAEIAVMGAEGAANIIFAKEIEASDDPVSTRKKKIGEYECAMMNPYAAASRGYVDDVILPSQTKRAVLRAFTALSGKKVTLPQKKHGNIPL